jgi:hypothetical protein
MLRNGHLEDRGRVDITVKRILEKSAVRMVQDNVQMAAIIISRVKPSDSTF